MVRRQLQRISLVSLFLIIGAISIFAQPKIMVSGKVISKEKQEVVDLSLIHIFLWSIRRAGFAANLAKKQEKNYCLPC